MIDQEVERILAERFGKDSLIALATTEEGAPRVRYVDALYENGSFYVITHALSGKMRQLAQNPQAAIAGEWFTAIGTGENMGYFGRPENADMAQKLRAAFAAWIDNGHNDFSDENTCILRLRLQTGVLMSHGTRYELDFAE